MTAPTPTDAHQPLVAAHQTPDASSLTTGQLTAHGVQIDTLRAAPHGELLDGLLVTTMTDPDLGRFTRVAVFDPAENTTVPDHRGLCHHAVAVASKHFGSCPNPLTAVSRAAAELHDPTRHGMRNPLTTAVWVDVAAEGDMLRVLRAGRCGDGDILLTGPDGSLRPVCSTPMWRPDAGDAWLRWCLLNQPPIDQLWFERERQIADRADYLCPPLGQFYPAAPDLADLTGGALTSAVVIATDGALLEELPGPDLPSLPGHLVDVLHRPSRWSHADIALAVLQPSA